MSHTKKFLEKVSVELGFGGEINETVLKEAANQIASTIDRADILNSINYEAFLEEQNEKQTSSPSLDRNEAS